MSVTEPSDAGIELSHRRIVRALAAISALLALLGLATVPLRFLALDGYWAGEVRDSLVRLFSLDDEGNVPSWWSSLLLVAGAALAACHARFAPPRDRARWAFLALGFFALSCDEVASIHEMSVKPIRAVFDPTGIWYYGWVVPGSAVAALAAAFLAALVLAQPRPVRARLVAGAAVYVSGALGVESLTGWIQGERGRDVLYHLLVIPEELLEMLGVVLLLSGLLLGLAAAADPVRIRIRDLPDAGASRTRPEG